MDIIEELKSLKATVAKLQKENKDLRKRVARLESGNAGDLRIKAKRVHGFTMSNIRGYYNAVRTVNGSQIRVYVGKNNNDAIASKKITAYLVENVRWLRSDIESCDDLMQIKEIADAVKSSSTS